MNYIEKVVIEGFWGQRTLSFDLLPDVNFIIGINGSGKTTAINLIAAALESDFPTLDSIEFEKITLTLKASKGRKKPEVIVEKVSNSKTVLKSIEYRIKDAASEDAVVYTLDAFDEFLISANVSPRYRKKEIQKIYGDSINEHLSRIVNVSWLSVHRASSFNDNERKSFDSTVDRKLNELENRLVRYFSTLGRKGSSLLEKFQESVFLSMLVNRSNRGLMRAIESGGESVDLEEEKETLNAIFSQFNLDERKYTSRVDMHFSVLKNAIGKFSKPTEGIENIDIAAIVLNDRIDNIIDDWKELVEDRKKIFKPRELFLQIINNMMQRKVFSISDQNELTVITQSGTELPLSLLSSGEKQLLIILGEALLQESKPWIYIADEPELSLHVNWQEQIVDNIRSLNPSAQILFATHSPDIVSSYGDRVYDMEIMLNEVHTD